MKTDKRVCVHSGPAALCDGCGQEIHEGDRVVECDSIYDGVTWTYHEKCDPDLADLKSGER